MSYVVLARKWRPQVFDDVVGQRHVTETLKNALRTGRVAHAFLFTGVRGVGKTTTARILAKALCCTGGPGPDPCNECPACREITAGSAVDVLEIDGASKTKVDQTRELLDTVLYRPSSCRYRVYIIDEVHMLSTHSFNALLKTLEEPPGHVKFIFATTEPHKIPRTILSRCQRYDFRLVGSAELFEHLGRILERERIGFEPDGLRRVVREAAGSVRDALSLLDQVIAYSGDRIGADDVNRVLGLTDLGAVREIVACALGRDVAGLVQAVRAAIEQGLEPGRLFEEVLGLLRNVIVLKALGQAEGAGELSIEELSRLSPLIEGHSLSHLSRMFRVLLDHGVALREVERTELVLEIGLIRIATLEPVRPIDELMQAVAAIETGSRRPAARPLLAESTPTPAHRPAAPQAAGHPPTAAPARPAPSARTVARSAPPPPAPTAPPRQVDLELSGPEGVRELWRRVVAQLKTSSRGMLASAFQQASLVEAESALEPGRCIVTLHFGGNQLSFEGAQGEAGRTALAAAFTAVAGIEPRVEMRLWSEASGYSIAREDEQRLREQEQSVRSSLAGEPQIGQSLDLWNRGPEHLKVVSRREKESDREGEE